MTATPRIELPEWMAEHVGPYTFVAADALVLKVREAGCTVEMHALLASGVNADGYREILGCT